MTSHDAPDTEAAGRALDSWLGIARPVEAIGAALESALGEHHAICLTAYEIMRLLSDDGGWTPLAEVCRAVDRSQPRISRLVTQMQDEGLVDRARVDGDGRAFRIRLTPRGREVHAAASVTLVEVLDRAAREDSPVTRLLGARTA
ncbi:MarR family transcriptional regulator [Nocardiopsis sp. N85]|uniref:MarR family winged helix-turn-helix transcriptional regulator n=1 Tax=Nocardiopsis sp. N85 TaxID=3029400 RepID=UPI00237F0BAC|nr:MarR family transcriptional regulator [Nocardiopsis sp. N85]MDE3723975.1 MarR family transcriptional regulator [Nocardiopsis sp. N85]